MWGVLMAMMWACGGVADPPPVSPRSRYIEIGKHDPPPGSVEVGPIEVSHGCGLREQRGTLEGAMILARNEAGTRNANYVAILSAGMGSTSRCTTAFFIRGIAYRVRTASAPLAAQPVDASAALQDASCEPLCSPGYVCRAAACIAVCNPLCGDGQVCRQDRTCGAAPNAPVLPAAQATVSTPR